jgi:hypothetical protein
VIHDKCQLVIGRIFLLLALLYPEEDFREIERGLRSKSATRRASGTELLEHLLPINVRYEIIGLASREPLAERLHRASPQWANASREYGALLHDLVDDPSEAIRAFAMYHEGELNLDGSDSMGQALGIIVNLPDTPANRPVSTLATAAS